MSDKRWTHQSTQKIATCLTESGITVCATVVRRLLHQLGYSLKANKKCLSAGNSPDRDPQFCVINRLRQEFAQPGDPVISVDTKKKELIGLFKNPGQTWSASGQAQKVRDHDFRSEAIGIAAPYGIYDLARNFGFVVVGQSADTPEFAANSILTWWQTHGREHYPNAKRLLILADGGGSNGARPRAWKKFLQEKLADGCNLTVTVAHYPTGASKWNPIEHRLFSEISKNWAGRPLESFDTAVNLIAQTTTKTGLHVDACRDQRVYEKGIKVSDKQMQTLKLAKSEFLGKWNYTISPRESCRCRQSAPAPEAIIPIPQAQQPIPVTKKQYAGAKM